MERKKLKFKKIDAFCDGISSGNPAGVIYLEEELSNEEMLRVAYQMKGYVSEVVYVKDRQLLKRFPNGEIKVLQDLSTSYQSLATSQRIFKRKKKSVTV